MNHYYCGKKNSLKVFGIVLFLALFSPCVVNASDEMVKEEKRKWRSSWSVMPLKWKVVAKM